MTIKTVDWLSFLKRNVLCSGSHIVIHSVPVLLGLPSVPTKRVDQAGPQAPPMASAASAMIARRRPWGPPSGLSGQPFCRTRLSRCRLSR